MDVCVGHASTVLDAWCLLDNEDREILNNSPIPNTWNWRLNLKMPGSKHGKEFQAEGSVCTNNEFVKEKWYLQRIINQFTGAGTNNGRG
jgi:hypothetical protein